MKATGTKKELEPKACPTKMTTAKRVLQKLAYNTSLKNPFLVPRCVILSTATR